MDRLRAELGLVPIPPRVGTELRTITPLVSEQVARLLRHEPTYTALSLTGQRLLLAALTRAVDEFARLVENRPPQPPTVETMLTDFIRVEDEPEACRAALDTAFHTVREVAHALWPEAPPAPSYSAQLDAALSRYAQRLCTRTMNAQRARPVTPTARPTGPPEAGEAGPEGLLTLVQHRWATREVQLYLTLSTLGAADAPPRHTAAQGTEPSVTTRSVHRATTDHLVSITERPVPRPRTARPTQRPLVICVGPMPVDQTALVHDIALLLLGLIRAGVAAPPSPVRIRVPNLGFLHPYPTDASVRKIRDLLLPLTRESTNRRSALARTLQHRLRTATTAQGLAKQLAMHPQTVHNHLTVLRSLFNDDLDFADDTLAMQAAVDLVLPLWELEAGRPPSSPDGRKVPGSSTDT